MHLATRSPWCPRLKLILAVLSLLPPAVARAQGPGTADAVYDTTLYQGLSYRQIGPSRGGRVTTVAGDPSRPGTFYFGSTGGGVWKSNDYGQNWRNVTDAFFRVGSMGALAVAPSDPDVIYAGTGSEAIRSNVSTGKGVYRSDDAGTTWRWIGLEDAGQIGAVEVDPGDPDVAYVAALGHAFGPNAMRGVFRTRDGGRSWDKVLFVSDSVGAVDLELQPGDPSVIYAAMWRAKRQPWTIISGAAPSSGDGIWKSTDGGDHWTHLTSGLPSKLIGKIDLAVSPAASQRVYALVEAPDPQEGLYRSDDAGESWRLVSAQPGLMNRPFYYTNVDADPKDADVVYVLNEGAYRSSNGGATFARWSTPHGDNHDLWIAPYDTNVMIESNDGGAVVTLNGGATWSTELNQPTAELYQVDVDDRFPYWVYGAQQDQGTNLAVPALPIDDTPPPEYTAWWRDIGGCETGPVVPKPDDPAIVYTDCKGRFGVKNTRTGQEQQYYVGAANMYGTAPRDLEYRFQRVSPIEVSPHDPKVVYHGSQYLMKTTDGGAHWERISPDLTADESAYQGISGGPITRDITGEEVYSVIYAIEESPLQAGLIWVGANDGPVHVTRDGGAHWTDVTPAALPKGARIQSIEPSRYQPGEAYIAAYRYLLDDWHPYIFRTTDYGAHWTLLTPGDNGIAADEPTRVVREDPVREGLLYAGTEFGMHVSFDEGAHWQSLQLDLPHVPVTDIEVKGSDLVLSTQGRSFWILDDVTPLRQLDADIADSHAHLFAPDSAVRMRYRSYGREPADPQYPPVGARIDYWLARPASGLEIDITGPDGSLVRSFSADSAREATSQDDNGGGFPRRPATKPPPSNAGMHRFLWDLRYPGSWSEDARRGRGNGPLAVPGTYHVRIHDASGWSETQPLQIVLDRRVAAAGVGQADVEAQLAFNRRVVDAISQARRTAARVQAALRATGAEAVSGQKRRGLESLERQLVTRGDQSYPQPMLVDQLEYLYAMTSAADQRPGQDAYDRMQTLRGQLDGVIQTLDGLLPSP